MDPGLPFGIIDTTTAPICGLKVSPKIYNIQQLATPDLRNSDKLDATVDGNLPNNLIEPIILTDLLSDKLSNSSIQYLYMHSRMNLAADTFNIPAPKFVDLVLSTVDAMDKGTSIWTHATIV